ncbi:MAG: outer membrane protein assembly factor BamE domain-containing protein [Alphaproteobacteria bacterium]
MMLRLISLLWLLVAAVGLVACADVVRRGEVVKQYQLELLQTGKSNYNDVLAALGTPSSYSTYDRRIWYYFSQTKNQWGFFDPSFSDQEVYQIKLNDKGIYIGYKKYTGDDAVKLSISKKTTPTVARDKSFLQELISNFGRYGRNQDQTGTGPGAPIQGNPFQQ